MKRNFTDALLLIVIALMLFTLHCSGAVVFWITGNTALTMPSYPQVDATTNDITISYWFNKRVDENGGFIFSKENTGLFSLKSDPPPQTGLDWVSTDWNTGFGAQLWRTSASFTVTNYWVHHCWTFTYTDTNSMRLYTNGVNMPGRWIQNPVNLPGTNANNSFGIATMPSIGASCLFGTTTEIAIWNKILNSQQIQLLGKSRVKGICQQIEPRLIRLYLPLDNAPYQVDVSNGVGDGGKFNAQPERVYGFKAATQVPFSPTGSSEGAGEAVHSYPPNE